MDRETVSTVPRATGLELTIDEEGVAYIEFDLPDSKVNKLTGEIVRALDQALAALEGQERLRGVILISRKEGNWIAGADIDEIRRLNTAEEARQLAAAGQRVLTRLAGLPIPSIAAIHGSCLGGGMELALACALRVATVSPKTQLGLPEIRLGIVPGFGGTQRLPRLVGIPAATDLILSGRSVDARKAERLGLVDHACPPEYLQPTTRKLLNEVFEHGMKRVRTRRAARRGRGVWLLGIPPLRRLWFSWARRLTERKSEGHYPAPLSALKAIEASARLDIERGLELEARLLGELVVTDVSRNLISLFFLGQAIKRDSGVEGEGVRPRKIDAAGVLGAGTMGGGIAEALAESGIDVRLKDVDAPALARGMGAAAAVLAERVRRRRLEELEGRRAFRRISASLEWHGFKRCGVLVEAIVEDLEVKKRALQEAERALAPGAILASNTSSLSVDAMASALQDPARFAGWHFFNPVDRMPLVEVVQATATAPEIVATLVALSKKLGKTPIVVRDRPGFLVNRLLMIYLMEAVRMLEEGVAIDALDAALRRFGMPMGPVMLFDQVGLDVAAKVAEVLGAAFPSQELRPDLLKKMVQSGRLGKKNGAGFYLHPHRGPARLDPHVYTLIGSEGRLRPEAEEIQDRLVLPMVNEASRILEEKVVRSSADVDAGLIYGAGFPPFRGGLLRWADALGARAVAERLLRLAERHGPRFRPSDPLMERATRGERFFSKR